MKQVNDAKVDVGRKEKTKPGRITVKTGSSLFVYEGLVLCVVDPPPPSASFSSFELLGESGARNRHLSR